MKTFLRIVLGLLAVVVLLGVIAYADGAAFPVDHTTSVTGILAASPARTFALITDVPNAASWRPTVQSVTMLPPVNNQDRWIEHLPHGMEMHFQAIQTTPPDASGHAVRVVRLADPAYGGDWTYRLSPGATPAETTITITESGYIHPPLYRFMMHHVFGMQKNLKDYLQQLQTRAAKG